MAVAGGAQPAGHDPLHVAAFFAFPPCHCPPRWWEGTGGELDHDGHVDLAEAKTQSPCVCGASFVAAAVEAAFGLWYATHAAVLVRVFPRRLHEVHIPDRLLRGMSSWHPMHRTGWGVYSPFWERRIISCFVHRCSVDRAVEG